jgi:hypothetical protein
MLTIIIRLTKAGVVVNINFLRDGLWIGFIRVHGIVRGCFSTLYETFNLTDLPLRHEDTKKGFCYALGALAALWLNE